jgi:hypothetical protein
MNREDKNIKELLEESKKEYETWKKYDTLFNGLDYIEERQENNRELIKKWKNIFEQLYKKFKE